MWVATDLHAHSAFSDGTASPEEVVTTRAAAALSVIALSDHDILAGVRRAARRADELGLRLLPAMEATAFFHFGRPEAEQVHILAYYPPRFLSGDRLEQTFLYQRGLRVQTAWRDFTCTWLDGLHADDRAALDPDGELSQTPVARFPGLQILIGRIVARRPQVFRHFIRHHVHFWHDDRALFGWTPEELIDAIRADGAVDIVAHPARYRDKERLARLLLGASGVEAYTSRHRPAWAAQFRAFAEAHGKLWTASTDDHQKPDAAYAAPESGTPAWVIERLLDEPLADARVTAAAETSL